MGELPNLFHSFVGQEIKRKKNECSGYISIIILSLKKKIKNGRIPSIDVSACNIDFLFSLFSTTHPYNFQSIIQVHNHANRNEKK